MKIKFVILLTITIFIRINFLQSQKQKVIFDCDLGGDIDDAFAVALLLSSHEKIDLLGITLGHGDTEGRAKIACKILYLNGLENIPVYVGRPTPGVVGVDKELAGPSNQYKWAEDFDIIKPQNKPAVDFIIETLDKYPGEVILITVGPVCNIGDVLDKRPDILKKTKRVVSMFGSFFVGYDGGRPCPEWNVRADIASARKLLNSGANIVFAGLDVTDHVILDSNYREWLLMRQSPMTIALTQLYAFWYKHAEWAQYPKMFDPVAVGIVLWPDLFDFKKVNIMIDDQGKTLVETTGVGEYTIATYINKNEFLERMMKEIIWKDFKRK